MATTSTTKTATASTGAGVKKPGRPKGGKKKGATFSKMQAFFKEHRAKHKHLSFGEQQKALGKEWKASPENPKNQA